MVRFTEHEQFVVDHLWAVAHEGVVEWWTTYPLRPDVLGNPVFEDFVFVEVEECQQSEEWLHPLCAVEGFRVCSDPATMFGGDDHLEIYVPPTTKTLYMGLGWRPDDLNAGMAAYWAERGANLLFKYRHDVSVDSRVEARWVRNGGVLGGRDLGDLAEIDGWEVDRNGRPDSYRGEASA